MKLSVACLALFASVASAGRPVLTITVQDGTYEGLEGMKPSLAWEGSSATDDVSFSYGLSSEVRPTKEVGSLPKAAWGQVKTDVSGWGLTARADISSNDFKSGDLTFEADNADVDVNLRLTANANTDGGALRTIQATKGLDISDGRVYVTPRYDVAADHADVVVGYNNDSTDIKLTASGDNQEFVVKHTMDNTGIKLTASNDNQELEIAHQMDNTGVKLKANRDQQQVTISQQLNARDRIAPTLTSDGDLSLEWQRVIDEEGKFTATLKPNDCIDVEWNDRDWTANVNMPISGADIKGASVRVKRDIVF